MDDKIKCIKYKGNKFSKVIALKLFYYLSLLCKLLGLFASPVSVCWNYYVRMCPRASLPNFTLIA